MVIAKPRKIVLRKRPLSAQKILSRMADIALSKHGNARMAATYTSEFDKNMLARLQSIAAKAEKLRNWDFMDGCFKQASELYVLASVLYEKFPEHTILSDGAFDGLARWLLQNKDHVDKEFWNWYCITAMDLEASTGCNVAARKPIPQYVYLITGQRIEEYNGTNRPRVLRRKIKRGLPKPPGASASNPSEPVRRTKKFRKPNSEAKAAKKDR